MRARLFTIVSAVVALSLTSIAQAATETFSGSATFQSDAESTKTISLPSFDTQAGLRVLLSVEVDVSDSGSVEENGRNLDPLKPASVQARMIRQYSLNGPGVSAFDSTTITTPVVNLSPFVPSNPDYVPTDGVMFGQLSYSMQPASGSPFFPNPLLYATPGPSTVNFTIPGPQGSPGSLLLMVNDQNFIGTPPDQWRLQVINPMLTIDTTVTYTYEVLPEPASLGLMTISLLAVARRRK